VGFVVDEMALGQVFLIVLIILPGPHIYPSTADAAGQPGCDSAPK
jgi:hypothetical protein